MQPFACHSFEVDPLVCPNCSGRMRIISFIEDTAVIERILRHLPSVASAGPHEFATHLLERDVDLRSVQMMLDTRI